MQGPDTAAASLQGQNIPPPQPPEPTVFVVDDDCAVLKALTLLFQTAGLHVETYASAQAFLDAYRGARAGCLVLDLRMPGMNGLELQALLARKRIRLPVIVLSGYADVPTTVRACKAGALDVIEKPVDGAVLLQRIRHALTDQGGAVRPAEVRPAEVRPAEVRPAEVRPAEVRPAEVRPAEVRPAQAQLVLASLGDGVVTTDAEGRIQYLNPAAERLTGWPLDEACGRPVQETLRLIDEKTREPVGDPLGRCLYGAGRTVTEDALLLVQRDGRELPITETVAPIHDAAGHILGAAIACHDASGTRKIVHHLSYHASHDSLTGLINRRVFEHRLERLLATTREDSSEHVLCYLDLDRFKAVNDAAGHAAGDQLLRELAEQLRKRLRQRDTLARLGGDEFAVLLEHCPIERAEEVANDMCELVRRFEFRWKERTFSVGVSVGVAAITADSPGPHDVLQAADAACYRAKEQGRSQVQIHRPEIAVERGGGSDLDRLLDPLRAIVPGVRLQLFHQTIVPLSGQRRRKHYEILLRMEEPGGRSGSPWASLPAAECTRLAPILDRWVVCNVLKWLVDHPHGIRNLYACAVNLSIDSLCGPDFPTFLTGQLDRAGIAPTKLCFEVAERGLGADPERAIERLQALKATRCRVAVDDFASTGFGFSWLKRMPVDFVKIDGYLIKRIVDEPADYGMVKTINETAHALGIRTVAKFVETEAISNTLRTLGVDYMQGYHISRPVRLWG